MFSSSNSSSGKVSAAQSQQAAESRTGSRSPGHLQLISAAAAALQGLMPSPSSSTRLPSSPSSHSLASPLSSPPSTSHSSPSPLSLLPPLPPSPGDYDFRVSAEEEFEQCTETDVYISSSMAGMGGSKYTGEKGVPALEVLEAARDLIEKEKAAKGGNVVAARQCDILKSLMQPRSGVLDDLDRIERSMQSQMEQAAEGEFPMELCTPEFKEEVLKGQVDKEEKGEQLEARIKELLPLEGTVIREYAHDKSSGSLKLLPQGSSSSLIGSAAATDAVLTLEDLGWSEGTERDLLYWAEQASKEQERYEGLLPRPSFNRPSALELQEARARLQQFQQQAATAVKKDPSASSDPQGEAAAAGAEAEDEQAGGKEAARAAVGKGDDEQQQDLGVEDHLKAAAASVGAAAAQGHLQQLQAAARAWVDYDAQQADRQGTLADLQQFRHQVQQLQQQKATALATLQRQQAARENAARAVNQPRVVRGFYCKHSGRVITANDSIFLRLFAAFEVLYVASDGLSEGEFKKMRQGVGQSLQQWGGVVRVQAMCHPKVPKPEQIAIFMRLQDPELVEFLQDYITNKPDRSPTLDEIITKAQERVLACLTFHQARAAIGEKGAREAVELLQRLNGGVKGGGSSGSGAGRVSGMGRSGVKEGGYWEQQCMVHPNAVPPHTNRACYQQGNLKREAALKPALLAALENEEDEDRLRQLVQCCCLASSGGGNQPYYPPPQGISPWKPIGGREQGAAGQQQNGAAGLPLPPPNSNRCEGCGHGWGHGGVPCAYTHPWYTKPTLRVRPPTEQLRKKYDAAMQQMKAAGVSFGQLFPQWLRQYKHKLSPGLVRELEQVVQQQGGPRVAVLGTELLPGFEGFAEELPETEEEYAASLLANGYHSAEEAAAAADAGEKLRQADWYQQYLLIGTPEGPETAELATMPPFMLQPAYLAACKLAYEELSIGDVSKAACLESGTMSAAATSVEPSKLVLQEVLALPHSFLQLPDCTQEDRDQQHAAVADEQQQQQQHLQQTFWGDMGVVQSCCQIGARNGKQSLSSSCRIA